MEYRMLPRAHCCCGLACACGVCVLGLRRSILRNREIWGASFVFWPGSADCVDVCSGEADSPWCVLAVVCPTGDSVQRICVTGFCRVLRYRLWEVRPVTTSSGVFVCDRENCIGRTKAGCQRWVRNCVERRGEFYITVTPAALTQHKFKFKFFQVHNTDTCWLVAWVRHRVCLLFLDTMTFWALLLRTIADSSQL